MKKIFFLMFMAAIIQKNYCQALKHYKVSRQSHDNCQQKTTIAVPGIDDTCIGKPDSAAPIFLKESVQAYKLYIDEIRTPHFPYNTPFTFPIIDIPYYGEREWEKAFKGISIPFR